MAVAKTRPAVLIRTRDNQRRSRARRREYVTDLEKRVHAFERLGAQAGVELQAAAQKVARENSLLRTLLRQHGVTTAEIETHLHGTSDHPKIASSATKSPAAATFVLRNPPPLETAKCTPAPERQTLVAPSEPHYRLTLSAATPESSNVPPSPATSGSTPQPSQRKMSHLSNLRQSPVHRPSPEDGAQAAKSGDFGRRARVENRDDVISCENAAWIIANLRGHDDAEEVRAELGCSPDADCTVGNMTVFHAMDR